MHPHTTMQLAAIRQDELLRAATRRQATSASRKLRTRWGREHREHGVRS